MKIRQQFEGEPTNGNMRKQRMEVLLSAWTVRPQWLRTDDDAFSPPPPPETTLTPEDWSVWTDVLRSAEPVPPRTHLPGLAAQAALKGLTVDELQSKRSVDVVGQRVATPWLRGAGGAAMQLGGHTWSLLVRCSSEVDEEVYERLLNKYFREVGVSGDAFLASTPWRGCIETAVVLLGEALAKPTAAALHRVWQLARALGVEDAFLDQLPFQIRRTLTDALANELIEAAAYLDVRTDLRLEHFAEGHENISLELVLRDLRLPASRLTELLEAESSLEHSHQELGDHYFEDVATAYANIADFFHLAATLQRLPPGRALLAALDTVCRRRPSLIATYVWHPAFPAEGAYALLQLPQRLQRGYGQQQHTLELWDEWAEIQRLGREQLALADRSEDWASVVALGVHDEAQSIGRTHYGVTRPLLQQRPYEEDATLWRKAVAAPERAKKIIDLLDTHLHARSKRGDASIVFSLRLLAPLRESRSIALEKTLARAIVDSYAEAFTLDATVLSVPAVLCAYGALLEDLRVSLRGGELDEAWRKWLRPFDSEAYLAQAKADSSTQFDSRTVHPMFHVPQIVLAHAETLVAQASASADVDDLLDTVLALYAADRDAGLDIEAFSWNALAQTTSVRRVTGCEPIFVRLGRLLRRAGRGPELLGGILSKESRAYILAYLLVGLTEQHSLAKDVQSKLRGLVNQLLADDNGIALGHALELANVMHQAGIGRDAERLARRALQIADGVGAHARVPYADSALAILAGALARQELWAEILALDVNPQGLAMRPQIQFVENMRAVALMETQKLDAAERAIEDLLRVAPGNRVALANRTALCLRRGEWQKAIEAAQQAKLVVPRDDWNGILLNEAAAREKLGDKFGAAAILDSLSPEARVRPDVVAARERLRTGRATIEPLGREDVSLGDAVQGTVPDSELSKGVVPPGVQEDDSVDVAVVTALVEEYEAVRDRLVNWQAAPAQSKQFANLYGWILGSIPKADGSGSFRVVLAWAGQSGNLKTAWTTMRTIERWNPRYLLFSGIAGGLAKEALKQGDIVLSQTIWHYEYGKIVDGAFHPRHRDFPAHGGLLTSARSFDSATKAWTNCGTKAPSPDHTPKCVPGLIGSGEKVIDDLTPAFVRAILAARPELQAVEMEAAGACSAIQQAGEEGRAVGFMMVRGISDMPKEGIGRLKAAVNSLLGRGPVAGGAGTQQRDGWKRYASAVSAHFIAGWIGSPFWPTPPRS